MKAFQILLSILFISIFSYTFIVIANDGLFLFFTALEQLLKLNWSGQFALDFSTYLLLSGLWIAWRKNFSVSGIVLGIIASVLGMIVFAPYLIWLSIDAKGNMKEVLLGKIRTNN